MAGMTKSNTKPAIVIHGGAGTISRRNLSQADVQRYRAALAAAVRAGQQVLEQGGLALDAVTAAVVSLEDCPLFNAGHGAVFTRDGTHELDAAIMDGRTLATGAIACARRIRNPVRAARAVMERSEYVFLAGEGADEFALEQGLACVPNAYFSTEARRAQWQFVKAGGGMALDHDVQARLAAETPVAPPSEYGLGTVGAVALDRDRNLAAATSTGGMTNKRPGRVGDSPLIGAGCYANNHTVAVSSTGTGEVFIRAVAAHDISARMEYAGADLTEACRQVIMEKLHALGGHGGVVAVDKFGNIALPFNTEGMYRGYARGAEEPVTAIHD